MLCNPYNSGLRWIFAGDWEFNKMKQYHEVRDENLVDQVDCGACLLMLLLSPDQNEVVGVGSNHIVTAQSPQLHCQPNTDHNR